jgi:hypothetical protein
MKKFLVIAGAVIVLFGGVSFASAQVSSSSESNLLADVLALVADLGRAVAALIEKFDSASVDTAGSTTTGTTKTPASGTTGTNTTKAPAVESSTYIRVTAPTGGNLVPGNTYEVKWEIDSASMGAQASPNFVSIYLVSPASATKTVLWTVSPIVKNTGVYKWTVSKSIYPGEYQIAIEPYARPNARAYGSSFTVGSNVSVPPTSTVTSGIVSVNPGMVDKAWGIVIDRITGRATALPGVEKLSDRNLTGNEPDRPGCGRWIEGYGYWWCNGGSHCGCGGLGNGAQGGSGTGTLKGGQSSGMEVTQPGSANIVSAWVKGSQQTVVWKATSGGSLRETDYVSIYLVAESDLTKNIYSFSRKAFNDGDFRVTVPSTLASGPYHVVVQSVANPSVKAISNAFSIVTSAEKATRETPSGNEGGQTDQTRRCCQWQEMWSGWQWVCGPGICREGGGT